MTRVKGRTVLADFGDRSAAQAAARRIRERDLGEVRVDALLDREGDAADRLGAELVDLSRTDLGPLSGVGLDDVVEALDHPGALVGRRPRQGGVLLTVVTSEGKLPAVAAIIRENGGTV